MRLAATILSLAGAVAPGLAFAAPPMSAEAFDAYTVGKTLTYSNGGTAYGVEQYLPNRRVRWAFVDDSCRIGHWYPKGQEICFVYEDENDPQCWTFDLEGGKLNAHFTADPVGTDLTEVEQSPDPLACIGPDVGV